MDSTEDLQHRIISLERENAQLRAKEAAHECELALAAEREQAAREAYRMLLRILEDIGEEYGMTRGEVRARPWRVMRAVFDEMDSQSRYIASRKNAARKAMISADGVWELIPRIMMEGAGTDRAKIAWAQMEELVLELQQRIHRLAEDEIEQPED